MTGFKFSVGQKVAVCHAEGGKITDVYPVAFVVEMERCSGGSTGLLYGEEVIIEAGNYYRVDCDRCFFHEDSLRPLNDDDYTDIEELKEVEA